MSDHDDDDLDDDSSSSGKKTKGQPYIPSYMDLSNGPEPCVVCGDSATGYHYRCMTCEGCKGFFRRTIQKNLKYHCKWNGKCVIDKNTRNQCQECRYRKCIVVGMATDLVLNDDQRVAKRRLIEENRERRKVEQLKLKLKHTSCDHDSLTDEDRQLIQEIVTAFLQTATVKSKRLAVEDESSNESGKDQTPADRTMWQYVADTMTPSIVKVVDFAKKVPGFLSLDTEDQILLLKSCCMEIMCLRAATRYNEDDESMILPSGTKLTREDLNKRGLSILIEPVFDFAVGLSKLRLNETEIALLAAVLLMQDRNGLKEPEKIEVLQDAILGAFKRYISETRPDQPVHWAKILMKVTDLRTISTRHAERILCIKLDCPNEIPPFFLELFDESMNGATPSSVQTASLPATATTPQPPPQSDDTLDTNSVTSPGEPSALEQLAAVAVLEAENKAAAAQKHSLPKAEKASPRASKSFHMDSLIGTKSSLPPKLQVKEKLQQRLKLSNSQKPPSESPSEPHPIGGPVGPMAAFPPFASFPFQPVTPGGLPLLFPYAGFPPAFYRPPVAPPPKHDDDSSSNQSDS